jgi:hypothetical protein
MNRLPSIPERLVWPLAVVSSGVGIGALIVALVLALS